MNVCKGNKIINFATTNYMLMYKLIISCALLFSLLFAPFEAIAQKKSAAKEYTIFDAIKLYQFGNIDQAKEYLIAFVNKNPTNDLANYYLSNLYMRSGDYKNALMSIQKAALNDPKNYWYLVQLARLYTVGKELDKAAGIYDIIKKEYPQKTTLYDDLIDLYIQQKQYDKAAEIIDEIEKIEGKNEGTVLTRFNILVYEGKAEEAKNILADYDRESPSPRTSAILGDLYMSSQNDSLGHSHYEKALSMDPSYSPARFGIAEYYRLRRQYDLYFENINPFLSDKSINAQMKVSYLKELSNNAQFMQMFIRQFDTMMINTYNAHRADSTVAYEFSGYLYQTGKPLEATKVLQDNIINYSSDKTAYRQYLAMLYYQEHWELLLTESQFVLEKFPGAADIMELKGLAYVRTNKIPEAIEIYRKLSGLNKKDTLSTANSLAVLGDLYFRIGDKKNSFKFYEKVLKIDPKNIATLNNYAYYLSLEDKNLNRAYEMSKITIDKEPNNSTYLDTFAWILYKLGRYVEAKGIFKQAMIYGGKDNADILDHYAETLFKLNEFDLAFIYWNQAKALDSSLGIEEKIAARKKEMK